MPANFNTIGINNPYVNESPMVYFVGSTHSFDFNYLGSGTLATPVNALYRNKEDVSATYLSGSTTVSGRTVTTKVCTFSLPGEYELYVTVTDNGMVRVKALRILIKKLGVY